MKIVADEHIPLLKGVLEPFAEVVYAAGKNINASLVRDADALLIRTRTKCDKELLANSSVKFIGTATVGTDHIDLDYCAQKNITVYSAAGCNAPAVMQYVITALMALAAKHNKDLRNCTLGIIGVGNVGSLVHKAASLLGMQVLLNDPPRAVREGNGKFITLDELLHQADIITLHVPLTKETESMVNNSFLKKMKENAWLINTSRGEVADETALMQHRAKLEALVLDVWNNEPQINQALLTATDIGTPHIAGYSIQGKYKATTMIVQAFANFFDIHPLKSFAMQPKVEETSIDLSNNFEETQKIILKNYPIFKDDNLLRQQPQSFEQLRNEYQLRNCPKIV